MKEILKDIGLFFVKLFFTVCKYLAGIIVGLVGGCFGPHGAAYGEMVMKWFDENLGDWIFEDI
ncbi:MAG: hypothetical protein IJL54_06400 [Prevotella sp.]|nr:hypothetical protein [Prevotella sp.]